MNWYRYSKSARVKYLLQFKRACEEAIEYTDQLIRKYSDED